MKKMFDDHSRESSGILRSGNRKYIRRGMSPDASGNHGATQKSNQEIISQVVPHLFNLNYPNHRYSENNTKYSASKLGSREDSLINY